MLSRVFNIARKKHNDDENKVDLEATIQDVLPDQEAIHTSADIQQMEADVSIQQHDIPPIKADVEKLEKDVDTTLESEESMTVPRQGLQQNDMDTLNVVFLSLALLWSVNNMCVVLFAASRALKKPGVCHSPLTVTSVNQPTVVPSEFYPPQCLTKLKPLSRFGPCSMATRVERRLRTMGLRMVPVDKDGNCFFRSVSFVLAHSDPSIQLSHQDLRMILVDYIIQHLHDFGQFFTSEDEDPITQLEDLLVDGTWCNAMADVLPLALARYTSRFVVLVTSHTENPTTILHPNTEPSGPPIVLAYIAKRGAAEERKKHDCATEEQKSGRQTRRVSASANVAQRREKEENKSSGVKEEACKITL
ncbi:Hypp3697 [Branchiostoma lanceolatum]|uniref:Hypp3697 protein n=1 Tax=Branchiostoma lanceolatum TaxID=7740 RepID=A0A8K0EXU2_BRALA|nr:Hypp3697 [Branchiostoma lanceolatum]